MISSIKYFTTRNDDHGCSAGYRTNRISGRAEDKFSIDCPRGCATTLVIFPSRFIDKIMPVVEYVPFRRLILGRAARKRDRSSSSMNENAIPNSVCHVARRNVFAANQARRKIVIAIDERPEWRGLDSKSRMISVAEEAKADIGQSTAGTLSREQYRGN